jgi:predicted alpha/beta hydrolase
MHLNTEIRTRDGKKIWLNCYNPATSTGRVMIIAPSAGVRKEYYDSFACFFRDWGFTVIVFDYRGIGSSAPAKLSGCSANIHQWAAQDIDAVILHAKNTYPKQEIIYIGHSIGGEIVGLAQASQYISRLVLVNSALSCKKLWPLRDQFRITAMKTVVRFFTKWYGYFPGKRLGLAGDLPRGVMHEWVNWCNSPNGLFDAFPDNNYRKLQVKLLAFSFGDDWHAPPRAVEELLSRFANAQTTWFHVWPDELGIRKIGHSGFFHARLKSILWMKLLEWLKEEDRKEKPEPPMNMRRSPFF